jgi:putative (di)nucleoside polyphosphate hydrolase
MKKYRNAVSVLVLKGKELEILLVHKPRVRDAWQLPQGGVEEGETDEVAALRELKEETGLDLKPVRYVSRQTYSYDFPPDYIERFHPVNTGQRLSFVVVEAASENQVKVDNREINDFKWVTKERLKDFIQRKEYLDIVLLVLEEFKEPRARN